MGKRTLLLIVLTIVSLISFAKDYYITTAVLNVRVGEGLEYPVSFILKKGDEVEVLSENNGWSQIRYFEETGYARSKYLNYVRTISGSEIVAHKRKLPYFLISGCTVLVIYLLISNGTFVVKSHRVSDVVKMIMKDNEPVKYINQVEVFRVLKEAVENGNVGENQVRHKENIKDMLGKHRIFE